MAKKKANAEIALKISVAVCEDGCCAEYHIQRGDGKMIELGDVAHGFHSILQEFQANGDTHDTVKDHMADFQGYDPQMPLKGTEH